jgi:uncharacterized protein
VKPRPVVIVFLRAPELGTVKRRLAAGIGMVGARRFYVDTSRALLRRIGADPRWEVHLAVTPDRAATQGRYWTQNLARFPQRHGDLGHRMERAILRFPNRPVVLIGSDIPDLDRHHLNQAFEALGSSDLVFGPATDGGYWLVGARNAEMVRGLFRNVIWSSPKALAQTLANRPHRRIALLGELDDIDNMDDFNRWCLSN